MIEIEDRDFLDNLYSLWAKTTGASDRFWMPEEDTQFYANGPHSWNLCAVNEEQHKVFLGSFSTEIDADFIAGVHGALPDLIRRLHIAIDEADRLDEEKDGVIREFADLCQENLEARAELHKCTGTISGLHSQIGSLESQLAVAREDADYYKAQWMWDR